MCIDILRNPPKALAEAKKHGKISKSWMVLGEGSALLGLSSAALSYRAAGPGILELAAIQALSTFIAVFVLGAILSLVLKIIMRNLCGTGKYFESLTVVSYSMLSISAGLFFAAIFAIVPQGVVLSVVAAAIGFACGISMLFRGIKDMFRTDMTTALVAVLTFTAVLLLAASVSAGLSAISMFGTVLPGV